MTPEAPPAAIRAMKREDVAAVAVLATQLGYPSTPEQILARFRALDASPDARVWVAEDRAGTVVGWIHVFANRCVESDPAAEIGGLVVHETTRGHGIGRALVGAAESWARERGYRVISVRSNVIRTEAHAFYQELGYGVAKTQVKFRKEL